MTKKGSVDERAAKDEIEDQVEIGRTGAETVETGVEVEIGVGGTEAETGVEIVIDRDDPPRTIERRLGTERIGENLEIRKIVEDLKMKKSLRDLMRKRSKNQPTAARRPRREPRKKIMWKLQRKVRQPLQPKRARRTKRGRRKRIRL